MKAAGLVILSVALNVLAPLVFLFFAYGRLLSVGELLVFFTLSSVFSLFSWLTPGGIGITEGSYAAVFSVLGLPIDGAVAFSLLQKLASLCIVGVGIIHLSHYGANRFAYGNRNCGEGRGGAGWSGR